MQFWEGGGIVTLLFIALLLTVAGLVRRVVPPIRALAMPDSMAAGVGGLILGPSVLGVLPLDTGFLEILVYHGLALVFIAVCLQPPTSTKGAGRTSTSRSMGYAIALVAVMQGFIGLLIVAIWSFGGKLIHPGLGLLLPLSFSQGPGQALSLGRAWEGSGLVHGGQVGLAMAAMGFIWCVVVGVPIVHLGRRRGWCPPTPRTQSDPVDGVVEDPLAEVAVAEAHPAPGALEPLARHMAVIGLVYLGTYGLLRLLAARFSDNQELEKTVYGFHFIIAMLLAMAVRRVLAGLAPRFGDAHPLERDHLARIGGLVVDVTTASAIAAVRIEQISHLLVPILVITFVGGVFSALFCLWVAPRAFPDAPFEQALALYGSSTGTLPTGLALLRVQDPYLRGPGATVAVVGSAVAVPLAVPLLLLVVPMPALGWPDSFPGQVLLTLGVLFVYGLALVIGWRFTSGLRFTRPLSKLWPTPITKSDLER